MRQPITFAYRNLVFGSDRDDVWALYRIRTTSYDGLGDAAKKELLYDLASFAYAIETDFQLLRVTRQWSIDQYEHAASATLDFTLRPPRPLVCISERSGETARWARDRRARALSVAAPPAGR